MKFAEKGLIALLFLASSGSALPAQAVQIKLVNGKTGRPVAGACIGVGTMKDTRMAVYIPTNKDGVAKLRVTRKNNEVEISYDPKLGCGGNGAINPILKYDDTLAINTSGHDPSCVFPKGVPKARFKEVSFSTNEVIQHGAVSTNTCGKVTASPQAGEVILFVRPRNFQEKMRDWLNSEAFPF
jgi:hypothetical protein